MGELIGVVGALAVIVEYLVNGIKEVIPYQYTIEREKIISLAVSVIACLLLPYIKAIPIGVLATLNIVERIILGVFVSRGSNVLYDLLRKLQGGEEV